jgi:phosphoribosylformylglycinamidine cyclo-ligase
MPITYKDAGVDIDAGDALVDRIKPLAARLRIPEVIDDVGGFAGLCGLPAGMRDPVLVSGTDGVGTKLEVAFATGIHDTIGIDLVAMCVNDVITTGARPLFFLDYFATSRLDIDVAEAVIKGIAEGCGQAGCALLGGETAELPGMYREGCYDLAGFAVGVVERAELINGRHTRQGDVVVGVASSGLHSNGYSLARRIAIDASGGQWSLHVEALGTTLASAFLVPTRIYSRAVQALRGAVAGNALRALCHITGGGLPGNLPRVLPDGFGARLNLASFKRPALFQWLQDHGPVEDAEMRRTFNLGVGMCVIVEPAHAEVAIQALRDAGEQAWPLGIVVSPPASTPFEQRVLFE